jgi:chemotaxis methyl-accepting protein methylase
VKPEFKSGIEWRREDFFSDPPGSCFHLVFVRNNLLTYYREHRSRPVLKKILGALSTGGYLIIGNHEKLPSPLPDLDPHPLLSYLYKKVSF